MLITGGLGYIGSHTTIALINKGYKVCIIDNLSNSSIDVLKRIKQITNISPPFSLAFSTRFIMLSSKNHAIKEQMK
jgi:UDP-glucose 4-epimerase